MVTDEEWQAKARAILKRELAGDGIKRRELVDRLAKIEVKETRAEYRQQTKPWQLQRRLHASGA